MPRASYSAEKNRIQKEIDKLEKKMQQLKAKERKPMIASIVKSMRDYDISLEDIAVIYNRKSATRAASKAAGGTAARPASKRVIPPKYRDPNTGATWTGRGKAPRWISDAEATGVSRDTFLIEQPAVPATI